VAVVVVAVFFVFLAAMGPLRGSARSRAPRRVPVKARVGRGSWGSGDGRCA
jgi:hypothetical protein